MDENGKQPADERLTHIEALAIIHVAHGRHAFGDESREAKDRRVSKHSGEQSDPLPAGAAPQRKRTSAPA